ncbi:MAG: hypothetical protein DRP74_07910, partial [Candidatus Omnitrophota bacterium]
MKELTQFKIQTYNYSSESHLEFDLTAVQQSDNYPWQEPRSAQLGKLYNYSLEVENIGDITATGWNVTLYVPPQCEFIRALQNGTWTSTTRKIEWSLQSTAVYASTYLNFTLNCTEEGKHVLIAEGVKNTTQFTSYINDTNIGCSGDSCSASSEFTFSKPNNVRYEELRNIDFMVNYSWSGPGLTLAYGNVNITGDDAKENPVWQKLAFESKTGTVWSNYTIDEKQAKNFVADSRNIEVKSYVDAITNADGNVTVSKIAYTWKHGKLFTEPQKLFIKTKVYEYVPLYTNFTLWIDNNDSKTTGGWGESFNFTVLVRDRFSRNVTVMAWHKTGLNDYEQISNWTCVNCGSWAQANFSFDYDGNDIGSWNMKINFTNADGGSETSVLSYAVEADDVNADYSTPATNAIINRSATTSFVINIYDRDNSSTPGYLVSGATDEGKGKIYIYKYGGTELPDSSPAISANDSGSLIRSMQNDSTGWCKNIETTPDYPLGVTSWYGGVTGATTYKNNLTVITTFNLRGDLYNSYTYPQGNNYTTGSQIPLQGSIEDDCGQTITDATVKFTLTSGAYSTEQYVTALGGVYKNLTYTLPSDAPLGWYNVTMFSNKTNYWNGSYTMLNAFYYGSAIQLFGQEMAPTNGGGWGESPFTFSVNLTNNQSTRVDLWLWNSSGWFYEFNTTYTTSLNNKTTVYRNFTCDDIGSWVAWFNATDVIGVNNNSLPNLTFTVERDDIIIEHYAGNNSYVNRSNAQPGSTTVLAVRINDTDYGNYTVGVDNTTALFTYIYNGTLWITEDELKNEEGLNYSLAFNPGCEYATGQTNWNMTAAGASCHKNVSSLNLVVNIVGDLDTTISEPDGSTNFTQNDNVLLRVNVQDDCGTSIKGLNTKYFNLTNGTNDYAVQCEANDEQNGWYNCTWASGENTTGYWNVTFYAGKTGYNLGTATQKFYLSSTPVLSAAEVIPSNGGWGRPNYTYTVNVTDVDSDTVTVKFWLSKDGGNWQYVATDTCTNCLNTKLRFNYTYSQSDLGNWSFKFNATDLHDNIYELYGGSHVVERDTVLIKHYAGNNSYVNRSNTEPGYEVQLATYLYDNDAGENTTAISPGATFFVYVTNKTESWVEWNEARNTTGGYYYITFKPTCNYSVGQQLWNMTVNGDPAYNNASSNNFVVNIVGKSNATYLNPKNLKPFERGSDILLSGTVYDECGSEVTGATVNYEIVNGNNVYMCNATDNNGWTASGASYNCTWDTTGKAVGQYNVTMTVNKQFYLDSSDFEQNAFKINATPMLTGADVSPRSDGWVLQRTFTVNVTDNAGDSVNVSLYELVSGTWVQIGQTKNCTSCSDYVITWNKTYTCSDVATGSRQFKINATDTEGNTYTTTGSDYEGSSSAFTIEKDNVVIIYSYGNET